MSSFDSVPTQHEGDLIGTVAGPGEGPNEFLIVTPDEQAVKTGEFITYTVSVEGTDRDVIARVTNREQERGLPDTFMADPNVAPETVAATLGVPTDDIDLYRLEATVIGFYDTRMQTFSNPRQLLGREPDFTPRLTGCSKPSCRILASTRTRPPTRQEISP
ncbi:hypothetical protein [Halospeciosus flavus]|uniref:Uncharacterized protein n=1 Tax=Halospeciosus flavus TaxID=3032283 RepID=A0ABD5Z9H3_9EURY|nr:hypothetical protein [Halospeciosus flavus]